MQRFCCCRPGRAAAAATAAAAAAAARAHLAMCGGGSSSSYSSSKSKKLLSGSLCCSYRRSVLPPPPQPPICCSSSGSSSSISSVLTATAAVFPMYKFSGSNSRAHITDSSLRVPAAGSAPVALRLLRFGLHRRGCCRYSKLFLILHRGCCCFTGSIASIIRISSSSSKPHTAFLPLLHKEADQASP